MNTPNKLTILRIILVPIFLVFLMWSAIPYRFIGALIIFIGASITDSLDGHIARKNNIVTNFGKFLDPLADKVLVTSALICFIDLKLASAIAVVIIIAREFLVTSLRLVANEGGVVIAASIWGKLKTVTQMVSIITILTFGAFVQVFPMFDLPVFTLIGNILIWISAAITVISGIEYLWANRSVINTKK